jgi:hypothetical protein
VYERRCRSKRADNPDWKAHRAEMQEEYPRWKKERETPREVRNRKSNQKKYMKEFSSQRRLQTHNVDNTFECEVIDLASTQILAFSQLSINTRSSNKSSQ